MKELITVGLVIILVGIAIVFLGALQAKDTKIAFGGFIGPIPFGFINDKKMLPVLVGFLLLAIIFYMLMRYFAA